MYLPSAPTVTIATSVSEYAQNMLSPLKRLSLRGLRSSVFGTLRERSSDLLCLVHLMF